jgi:hypothetical protein
VTRNEWKRTPATLPREPGCNCKKESHKRGEEVAAGKTKPVSFQLFIGKVFHNVRQWSPIRELDISPLRNKDVEFAHFTKETLSEGYG